MARIRNVTGKLSRVTYRAFRTPREIARMRELDTPSAVRLAAALDATLRYRLQPQDRVWLNKIEVMRGRLATSREPIYVTDFGAGAENDLSPEQAEQGVQKLLTISEVNRSSRPRTWGILLFQLVKLFRPRVAIELGTCLGVSAAYQAASMQLLEHGRLITLEGAPELADYSRRNLLTLGLGRVDVISGRFQDKLDWVLQTHRPVGMAFIDGHHDEKATLNYFQRFLPHLTDEAVLVFDDIRWSDGMQRAWQAISAHERVEIAVDMVHLGLCVMAAGKGSRHQFKVVIS